MYHIVQTSLQLGASVPSNGYKTVGKQHHIIGYQNMHQQSVMELFDWPLKSSCITTEFTQYLVPK